MARPSRPARSPSSTAGPSLEARWRLDGTGKAVLSTAALPNGTAAITAVYGATTNFLGSTSPVLNQVVGLFTTSTALASSLNPSLVGQSVTFTAQVSTGTSAVSTGTVTFYLGNVPIGTGNLDGTGVTTFSTSSLTVGSNSITATYSGTSTYSMSTSAALVQVVNSVPVITPPTITRGVAVFKQNTNKKGRPVGKPVFKGFEFDFSTTMDQGAASSADYTLVTYVTKRVRRKTVVVPNPIRFTVSINSSFTAVTLMPAGKQTFSKGGRITLLASGLKKVPAAYLASNAVFNISPGGKRISRVSLAIGILSHGPGGCDGSLHESGCRPQQPSP